ncbi:MAG: beta strand repeat-containing protein, partial [Elsteraceae bacterium]
MSSAQAQSPQAPTVAAGSVAITRQGATTVVTQSTDRGIIDWRSFSIGAGEAVRFDQPGRSSVTLNRVTGSELSRIDGNLSANGQVWLANPNGVMIGPGGQVNVGGLLATTGRIDAQEFLRSGRAQIDQIAKDAAILNGGSISIAEGGYAGLAAAAIKNEGVIAARSGTVALGAGKAMTVDFAGDKLIQYQVTQPLEQAPANADALIVSTGTIAAQGGTVLMSARAAKGVMDSVVNLKGHVVSNTVRVDGGTVVFGDGGAAQVSGRIDASNAAGLGGKVEILGEKVGLLDGAAIDASGSTGGGTVLVGGDWQGKGAPGANGQNALVTYVAPTASINVDATTSGDGGKAVIWADDTTRFNGVITAKGGLSGGDGGKVETSGKRSLDVGPMASVNASGRAPAAKAGSWLLDPADITISSTGTGSLTGGIYNPSGVATGSISDATIIAGLATTDVTIQTSAGTGSFGDITVTGTANISYSGGTARTLTLAADRNIVIQSGGTINLQGAAHNIVLNARALGGVAGAIDVAGYVGTSGGAITLGGGAGATGFAIGGGGGIAEGVRVQGSLLSNGGNITLRARGANSYGVNHAGGSISSGAGNIDITSDGGSGAAASSHGYFMSGGGINTTTGAITINATGSTGTGSTSHGFYMNAGSVNATSGSGQITINGFRGNGNGSVNVYIGGGTVSSVNGAINLLGTTTGGGGGTANVGVRIDNGSSVVSTAGGIFITGNGAAAGIGSDFGINIGNGSAATISTGATGINLSGGTKGIFLVSGTLSAAGSSINLTGDFLSVSASTISTSGTVTIAPATSTTSIGVNGGAGGLTVSNATLASIAGSPTAVTIGSATMTSGQINVGAGLILPSAINTNFTTGGGNISFAGAMDGPSNVTLDAGAGTVTFAGSVGATTGLGSLAVNSLLDLSGTATMASGGITINSGLVLRGAARLIGAGQVSITGAANAFTAGADSLTLNGGAGYVRFASIGATSSLASLTATASTVSFTGGTIQTTGTQSYTGQILLNGSVSLSTTNASVFFPSTVNAVTSGGAALTVATGTGTASFTSGLGASTALAAITTNAAALGTIARTTGTQSYGSLIILSNTVFSTNNFDVRVAGAINSATANTLTFTTNLGGGKLSLGGQVGSVSALADLSLTNTSGIFLNGVVRTAGQQSYVNPVTLSSSTSFFTTNSNITFDSTVDAATAGGAALSTAIGTGTLSLTAGAGSTTALSEINTSRAVIAGVLATTVSQNHGNLILLSNATLSTVNSTVSITSSVEGTTAGGQSLTIAAGTGGVSLPTAIGNTTALSSLTRTGSGLTTLGGTIVTTGTQNFGGAVTTTTATAFSTSNADVTFTGALNGSSALNFITGVGTVTFAGGAGGTTALTALTVGRSALSGTIVTTGAQSYTTATRLLADVQLSTTNASVGFSGALQGPGSLAIAAGTGVVSFGSAVSATTPLNNLTRTGSGATEIGAAIRATGSMSFAGAVHASATAGTLSTTTGAIIIPGGIQGAATANGGLTIASASGNLTLPSNAIGSITPLANLTVTSAGTLSLTGAVGTIRTTGAQSFGAAMILANGFNVFSTTNANIFFGSTLDGTGSGNAGLTVAAGTGTTSFGGALGGTAALATTTVTGTGPTLLGANISLIGNSTFAITGATTLTNNVVAALANNGGSFGGAIDGAFALSITSSGSPLTFGGAIGATTALASFT